MKKVLTLFLIAVGVGSYAQQAQKFNLGFEDHKDQTQLPDGWIKWGSYELTTDSPAHSGKSAVKITSDEAGTSFGSVAYPIPANYEGKLLTFEGFMKIEEVEGFAGLLMRVDGKGSSLAFKSMQEEKIEGSSDWKKYSISLDLPREGETIYVGGIMGGKGKAWFDEFRVMIDGKDIQDLEEVAKKVYPASLDKEFDNGSNISFPPMENKLIADLDLLGKVWGFLKYHHPEVAKGNFNWDYELFRILPDYLKVTSDAERDQVLTAWINKYGPIKHCVACTEVTPDPFASPDHSWMSNSGLSGELQKKLNSIYKSRNNEEHFYLSFAPEVGNPEFNNEESYYNMPYPDEGFRLLALFKYWNIIHYFFPNKHLTDKDWNIVLKEYIPLFMKAGNELEYEMAAVKLIGEIQDTHANLWGGGDKLSEWKGNLIAPVQVRFIEDKLVVTDYYNPEMKSTVGLEIGDIITEINGKKVEEIVEEIKPLYPASNEAARLRDIGHEILQSNDQEIDIKYISEAGEQKKKLKLFKKEDLNTYYLYRKGDQKTFEILDGNIGYVTLESITRNDFDPIKKQLRNTDGIIIDIRNYPNAFIPFELGTYFTSEDKAFVKFSSGSLQTPGEFTLTKDHKIPGSSNSYKGKLVVLVNEISQSNAEYSAMALRAGDNTTIVGSTTAGADGNVSALMLPGGLRTMISGIGVYYPDGGETQRIGIVPDVEVKPTIEGIKNGRDELLEKAIEIIKAE